MGESSALLEVYLLYSFFDTFFLWYVLVFFVVAYKQINRKPMGIGLGLSRKGPGWGGGVLGAPKRENHLLPSGECFGKAMMTTTRRFDGGIERNTFAADCEDDDGDDDDDVDHGNNNNSSNMKKKQSHRIG